MTHKKISNISRGSTGAGALISMVREELGFSNGHYKRGAITRSSVQIGLKRRRADSPARVMRDAQFEDL